MPEDYVVSATKTDVDRLSPAKRRAFYEKVAQASLRITVTEYMGSKDNIGEIKKENNETCILAIGPNLTDEQAIRLYERTFQTLQDKTLSRADIVLPKSSQPIGEA